MKSNAPCFRPTRNSWRRCQPTRTGWQNITPLAVILAAFLSPTVAWSQDTPVFFQQNCISCHTIGGGRLVGPDLKDVTERQERDWLIGFMMNPKSYIDRGDPYAVKLLEEARQVPMPVLAGMTRERCENLLDLIEAESQLEESQFKGLQISNEPFTDANRTLGREIFLGLKRLENRGTPCISCHSMHDTPLLGGGALAPKDPVTGQRVSDLTNVYERLDGRKALSAWLVAPATETMQPIFKDRPIVSDEIHALVAYFEASAGESPAQPTSSRLALLFMGLLGAAAVIFAFDAIWKRRFHSVRQPLVDSTSLQTRRPSKDH